MQQPELTADQWKRRALRAEGAVRHALWLFPIHHPQPETADEMAKRFRMHIEATYPDLIVRYNHRPMEVWKYAEDCGCEDDGSEEYENAHCEEGEDGYLCSRSFLGRVCDHCKDEDGDGPEWQPDRVEWPCPPIAELDKLTDAQVLANAMTGVTATPPDSLRWIIGGDQHTLAWETAAHWMHVNGHLDAVPAPSRREAPCHDCWRAAAFAVKGVLLADYQRRAQVLADLRAATATAAQSS